MIKFSKSQVVSVWFAVAGMAFSGGAVAQSSDSEKVVREATSAYLTTMTHEKKQMPYTVLRRAIAVAIFPGVTKAGIIVGGTGGTGVLLVRRGNGWTGPAFYDMEAASIGFQVGVQKSDIFLLIMNQQALNSFMKPRTTLGQDAAVAVGPEGAKGGAFQTKSAGIVTYNRVRGAFIGASLQGARIKFSNRLNDGYWGNPMRAQQILLAPPAGLRVPASGRFLRGFMRHDPNRNLIGALQIELAKKGFYRAGIDGISGRGMTKAILDYERANNLPPTGRPTNSLLYRLRGKDS